MVDKQALKTNKLRGREKGVSEHHIKYLVKDGYDWTVFVTKGEHLILSRLAWYTKKRVSNGLITALQVFIKENKKRAKAL